MSSTAIDQKGSAMRVFELAKQLGKTSKELLADLAKQGAVVKGHMSTIDEDQVQALVRKYAPKQEPSAELAGPKRGHVLIKKRVQPEPLSLEAPVAEAPTSVVSEPMPSPT